jgi:F420-dependent oxidoreductase-like protein
VTKLGYVLGPWASGPPADGLATVMEAERLGFDSVWSAEAYGSDAFTPLAWYGAHTSTIKLATGIAQMPARTPTATAMAAMTLDHLCAGRFILGLGASGPQVVEGWYGQPYPRPLARSREYVDIIRRTVARHHPVTYAGQHFSLPFAGGTGLGKPLRTTIHPRRADLPIFLGAEGPNNVALAAEIADGWVAMLYPPKLDSYYRERLADGFARRSPDLRDPSEFEIVAVVPVAIDRQVETAADRLRPFFALYMGGMGARSANFHFEAIVRAGWEAEAMACQKRYLAGEKAEAIAGIPLALIEDFALVGPPEKIRDELPAWQATAMTTLVVNGSIAQLRTLSQLF